MRARPRPRHGWLAPTASPHALARWGWLKARRSSGRNPASTEARAVRSPDAHGLSQEASPRAIGALSLHDATRVAELRARGACLGRASSGRRAGVERGRARAGALERSRLGPRTTCSWVRGRASGGASGPSVERILLRLNVLSSCINFLLASPKSNQLILLKEIGECIFRALGRVLERWRPREAADPVRDVEKPENGLDESGEYCRHRRKQVGPSPQILS